jgi:hypothetical protein
MDEHGPDTESSGALTPPPAHPPTAVAASAPLPPRGPSASRVPARRRDLRGLIDSALDGLDAVADRIAGAAGLR